MTFEQLSEVWTPLSVAIALVTGIGIGYLLVARYAADPAYASGVAAPAEYAALAAGFAISIGLVFYGGQILTSWATDPEWTRVVSRYGLWVVYSVAIAVGTLFGLRRRLAVRRSAVHDRAVLEIKDESQVDGS